MKAVKMQWPHFEEFCFGRMIEVFSYIIGQSKSHRPHRCPTFYCGFRRRRFPRSVLDCPM
jgi:hypothetical protein